MRIRYSYLFPIIYLLLSIVEPFLGPYGTFVSYAGIPMSYYAALWYVSYGDPTFVSIIAGTLQWAIIGVVIDVWFYLYRTKLSK